MCSGDLFWTFRYAVPCLVPPCAMVNFFSLSYWLFRASIILSTPTQPSEALISLWSFNRSRCSFSLFLSYSRRTSFYPFGSMMQPFLNCIYFYRRKQLLQFCFYPVLYTSPRPCVLSYIHSHDIDDLIAKKRLPQGSRKACSPSNAQFLKLHFHLFSNSLTAIVQITWLRCFQRLLAL